MRSINFKWALFALLVLCLSSVRAESILQTKITYRAENITVEKVLSDIEIKLSIYFSYPSELIPAQKKVFVQVVNKPLESVLVQLLGNQLKYLERGSFIIIQPKRKPVTSKQEMLISGQIFDAKTGQKISNATIYEVNSLKSTQSSKTGNYDLSVKEKSKYIEIAISKEHYQDTILRISRDDAIPLTIELKPIKAIHNEANRQPTDTLKLVQWLVTDEALNNMNNVHLYEKRLAQISLLPRLGTNRLLSGKTTNNLSFNVLAGYSFALKGIEVGGLCNIVRQNMTGIQVSGLSNIVGGESQGIQVSGFTNVNKLNMDGIQVAGFMNTTTAQFNGIQSAGLFNYATVVNGLQVAGVINAAWSNSHAYQVSGYMNLCESNVGTQFAGAMNIAAKEFTGVQIASLVNYAGRLKGMQFSLISNTALRECNGMQMSVFLNSAGKLNGVQLGLINFCDTVEAGVNIGLLSFVRKGVHSLQFHVSEITPFNALFKTGTNQFYNIIAAGYRPDSIWTIGYGIGSQHLYTNGLFTGLEIQINTVQNLQDIGSSINVLSHIHPFMGFRFHKLTALSIGPVFNIYYAKNLSIFEPLKDYKILPNPFYNVTDNEANLQMSFGFRAALILF